MSVLQNPAEKTKFLPGPVLLNTAELKPVKKDKAASREIQKAIEEAYKKDHRLHPKLLCYTLKKIRVYFKNDTMGVHTAEDVVQTVIMKLLAGERSWNKEQEPDFVKMLLMSIYSYVRNEYRKGRRISAAKFVDITDDKGNLNENMLPVCFDKCMEEDLENEELRRNLEDKMQKCLLMLEQINDAEAYFIFEMMASGMISNVRIGENLNLTVKEVENAKKRIRRIVNRVWEKEV